MEERMTDNKKELVGDYHKSNASNLEQDKQLAEEVQRFPCLYDKRDPGYKRNDIRKEAWVSVAESRDWVLNSDDAARLFEVLKKRYSKKKMNYKRAHHLANSDDLMRRTKEDLDKYQFMGWMEPYIRFRTVRLAIDLNGENTHDDIIVEDVDSQNIDTDEVDIDSYQTDYNQSKFIATDLKKRKFQGIGYPNVTLHSYGPGNIHNNMAGVDDSGTGLYLSNSASPSMVHAFPSKQDGITDIPGKRKSLERREMKSAAYSYNSPDYTGNHSTIDDPRSERTGHQIQSPSSLESAPNVGSTVNFERTDSKGNVDHTVYQSKLLNDEDDLFAAMLVAQLRKLNDREKVLVKHEINNVLFKAQMKQFEKKE